MLKFDVWKIAYESRLLSGREHLILPPIRIIALSKSLCDSLSALEASIGSKHVAGWKSEQFSTTAFAGNGNDHASL